MARNHVWKFLVNQAGEPIEGANVSIYKAGTEIPVWVYFDEFAAGGSREAPQVRTLENGYFEFWIDEDEDFDVCNTAAVDDETAVSYGFNQKFKIAWEKTGIAQGYVDYVDVFPPNRYFQPVALDKCNLANPELDDIKMNRTISQALACKWNTHVDSIITDVSDPTDIHGLDYLATDQPNDIFNKIVKNEQGWLWDIHEMTNVWEYSLSGSTHGGQSYNKYPHGIEPLLVDGEGQPIITGNPDEDDKFNKVVSNTLMNQIVSDIDAIKQDTFTISLVGATDFNWTIEGDHYEAEIGHNLPVTFPNVTCYGWIDGKWMMVKEAEVEYVDINTIKISIASEPVDFTVRITS